MNTQPLGYHVNQTENEEKKALQEGFELVRATRHLGGEIRAWAEKTDNECKMLLHRLKRDRSVSVEIRLWDLSCLENKILQTVQNYIIQSTDLMKGLTPLNPPLRTDQIRPMREAMIADRAVTSLAIEPLTKTVAELTAYKLDLSHSKPGALFTHRPI